MVKRVPKLQATKHLGGATYKVDKSMSIPHGAVAHSVLLSCIDMAIKRQHRLGSPSPSTGPTKAHYLVFAWYVAYILLGIFFFTVGTCLLAGDTYRQTVGRQAASGTGSHSASPLVNNTWVALVEDESPAPNWYGQVTVWIQGSWAVAANDGIELMPFLTS